MLVRWISYLLFNVAGPSGQSQKIYVPTTPPPPWTPPPAPPPLKRSLGPGPPSFPPMPRHNVGERSVAVFLLCPIRV